MPDVCIGTSSTPTSASESERGALEANILQQAALVQRLYGDMLELFCVDHVLNRIIGDDQRREKGDPRTIRRIILRQIIA